MNNTKEKTTLLGVPLERRVGLREKVTILNALALIGFFAIANFGWQWFQDMPDFAAATERTYFQAWALILAWAQWK